MSCVAISILVALVIGIDKDWQSRTTVWTKALLWYICLPFYK